MYLNKEKTIKTISSFLSDYIKNSSQKNFFVIYDGSTASWLSIKLCEEARKTCGAEVYYTDLSEIDADYRFEFARKTVFDQGESLRNRILETIDSKKCLSVSCLNINNGVYYRSYKKHIHFSDIYPVLDLYNSDCIDLAKFMGISERCLINCKDTDEKFKPNSYEYEFCFKEDVKNSIIKSDISPIKRDEWFKYTKPQKDLIAFLHQREKITRHKDLVSRGALFPRIQSER